MIEVNWMEQSTRQLPEGGDATDHEFGQLFLDLVETDSYDVLSLVTEHSVEGREQITDHQVPQLDRVSLDVVVSDSPSGQAVCEGVAMSEHQLSTGASVSLITSPEGTTRAADAFEELRRLCREGVEVDVDGLRRPIEGWLIEAVSSPRDINTAGALTCTISLVEMSVAATSEVDAPSSRVERARPAVAAATHPPSTHYEPAGATTQSVQETRSDFFDTETGEPV